MYVFTLESPFTYNVLVVALLNEARQLSLIITVKVSNLKCMLGLMHVLYRWMFLQ